MSKYHYIIREIKYVGVSLEVMSIMSIKYHIAKIRKYLPATPDILSSLRLAPLPIKRDTAPFSRLSHRFFLS